MVIHVEIALGRKEDGNTSVCLSCSDDFVRRVQFLETCRFAVDVQLLPFMDMDLVAYAQNLLHQGKKQSLF